MELPASPMFRVTSRDLAWIAVVAVALIGWGYEHSVAAKRHRKSQVLQADLAFAIQRQIELAESMQRRLDEYENEHVLMRRLLRLAQQKQP
jgi:hypothetical protein